MRRSSLVTSGAEVAPRPRSWAASILGVALTVLAACVVLNLAARLLASVAWTLLGMVVAGLAGMVGWRHMRRRGSGW